MYVFYICTCPYYKELTMLFIVFFLYFLIFNRTTGYAQYQKLKYEESIFAYNQIMKKLFK